MKVLEDRLDVVWKDLTLARVDALERSGHFSFPGDTRKKIEWAMINYLGSTDSIGG